MALRFCVVLACLLAANPAMAQVPPGDVDARLQAIFDREWEWEISQDPLFASYLGDRRWNDRWTDMSLEALASRQAHRQQALDEVSAIPRDQLSPANRVNYDTFIYQQRIWVEGYQHRYHLIRTSTLDGIQNMEMVIDGLRFQTTKDFDDWIARLDVFPALLDQNIVLMREGMKANVLLPKVIVGRVRQQLVELSSQPVEDSGYYRPFKNIPGTIPAPERERIARAGAEHVRTRVQPAFRRLLEFIDRDYMAACYDGVGWWRTSSGLEGYKFLARSHTTTEMSPQEIHALGLKEVARIGAEMESIRKQVGFSGTLTEFFTHLRTDPKFFYSSGDALLDGYRSVAKRIDPELIKISRKLPRLPYGVIPIPAAVAPVSPAAFASGGAPDGSRPCYFFANLDKPDTRPKWEMLALTLHEAVPGHCLQISAAQELEALPQFRRNAFFTAYTEGWGLYAESLGDDMGLYDGDPYSKFGQLTYEMWRAVRLVVDTGLHAMEWDRAQAITYFLDHTAKLENDVTNEVDRYISVPGQALAYKIGELKIKELRRRCQDTLGGRFDLRDFNDVILQTGSVPLSVLEQRVDEWLAAKQQAATP